MNSPCPEHTEKPTFALTLYMRHGEDGAGMAETLLTDRELVDLMWNAHASNKSVGDWIGDAIRKAVAS